MKQILTVIPLFLASFAPTVGVHAASPDDFRLKILAAKEAGIDTTSHFKAELAMYARELATPYLRDKHVDDSLVNQAYGRLKEWVDVSHIYIPAPANPSDTVKIKHKADSLRKLLITNPAFGEKATVGSGNWPYFFEEMAYRTPVGSTSGVVKSDYGWHIVRVDRRRANTEPLPSLESIEKNIRKAMLNDERAQMAIHRTLDRWRAGDASRSKLTYKEAETEFIRELPAKEEAYRKSLEEYRNAMLVYEITDREVWSKASADSAGLQEYFNRHRQDFSWDKPHYKGFVISATTDSLAQLAVDYLTERMKSGNEAPKATEIRKRFGNNVWVDRVIAGRGENKTVDYLCFGGPIPADDRWKAYRTAMGKIIPAPESAFDIKGPVTEAYQRQLEKQWLERLRARH